MAAAALLATHCPSEVLGMLDDTGNVLMGRPRHPGTACLLALMMQRARIIRSENELVKTLSTSVGSARFLRFLDLGGEHSKSPHNRVFTRTRRELGPLLEDLHTQLVREAMRRGLVKGRFVMLDTMLTIDGTGQISSIIQENFDSRMHQCVRKGVRLPLLLARRHSGSRRKPNLRATASLPPPLTKILCLQSWGYYELGGYGDWNLP